MLIAEVEEEEHPRDPNWEQYCQYRKQKEQQKQTKQVCTKFREGQVVCDDPTCRKLHIMPKKDCTNDSYKKFGICSNWSKCRSRHPWDARRWGDKDAAYAKYKDAQKHAKQFIESKMVS